MKQLTIEEKAKAYDKAIEIAKSEYQTHKSFNGFREMLTRIFPELKESEDKKIMKCICLCLEECVHNDIIRDYEKDKCLAWLEKQCETFTKERCCDAYLKGISDAKNELENQSKQKPFDYEHAYIPQKDFVSIKPKFKVGYWLQYRNAKPFFVEEITKQGYVNGNSCLPFNWENEIHLWTIQDAKDGDVLVYKDEISIYKHDIKNCTKEGTNFGGFVYHCCYDGKRFITDSLYSLTEKDKKDIYPATKEQHDILIKAMADAGYEWDVEKKELKKQEIAEIPFGAKDSELQEATYYIPKGFHAEIDGNKVVIKKGNQKFIKYIRKDAFIEKASKWIEENIKKWYENIKVHGFRGMTPLMITKFKKYMEE